MTPKSIDIIKLIEKVNGKDILKKMLSSIVKNKKFNGQAKDFAAGKIKSLKKENDFLYASLIGFLQGYFKDEFKKVKPKEEEEWLRDKIRTHLFPKED